MQITKSETKSNWECVSKQIKDQEPIELGAYNAALFYQAPQKMLQILSSYKFAAKMIGPKKKILDLNCKEGFGSFVLFKECGFVKGIDENLEAIELAKSNFSQENLTFSHLDFNLLKDKGEWDAVVCLGENREILNKDLDGFLKKISSFLFSEGVAIVTLPQLSRTFEELKQSWQTFFTHVFLFSLQGEVIHAGDLSHKEQMIFVGCKKR